MESQVVITATLMTTASGYDVAVYVPIPGLTVLGWSLGLFVILFFFLASQRFEMWACLVGLIISVLYVPFSLTVWAPYFIIMAFLVVIAMAIIKFFQKATSLRRRR